MICRDRLLKSLQAAYLDMSYVNCICGAADQTERELLFTSGLELSRQLQ